MKAIFLRRVIFVLVSTGLFACGGGGDFGVPDDDSDEPEIIVEPLIGTLAGETFLPETVGIEPSEIAAGGTALLTVAAVWSDTGELIVEPLNVEFTSQCASEDPPRAVITPQLQIRAGVYQAEYEATGCTGDDVIVVNLDGVVAATGVVSILTSEVGTIQFVSAEPEQIALSGFGSVDFPEFSDVTFRVLESAGLPVPGRTVNFELTNTIGGVTLVNTSAVSDQAGDVVARVQSGIINTTVRIIASYTTAEGVDVQTVSGPIAINSGLADQDSFDIATSVFNPLAFNYNYALGDEAPVTISVFAADYFNNPVPDGTRITFVSESGGQIEGDCATESGACSVTWASSGERPADGVLTIVARVVGEESFTDVNGNGLFDVTELSSVGQKPDAFLDANESRFGIGTDAPESAAYDPGEETFFDFDDDGQFTFENALYDGAGCTEEAQAAGHCAGLIEARQSIALVLSGDDLEILFENGASVELTSEPVDICYKISDGAGDTNRDNIPPAGTEVVLDTGGVGEIVAGFASYQIPNQFSTDPYEQCVSIKGDADPDQGDPDVVVEPLDGFLTVTATVPAPSGAVVQAALPITKYTVVEQPDDETPDGGTATNP